MYYRKCVNSQGKFKIKLAMTSTNALKMFYDVKKFLIQITNK